MKGICWIALLDMSCVKFVVGTHSQSLEVYELYSLGLLIGVRWSAAFLHLNDVLNVIVYNIYFVKHRCHVL